MTNREWVLVGAGVVLAIYLAFVLALFLAGRRSDARALAGFVRADQSICASTDPARSPPTRS